jgi:hypothetical protein
MHYDPELIKARRWEIQNRTPVDSMINSTHQLLSIFKGPFETPSGSCEVFNNEFGVGGQSMDP